MGHADAAAERDQPLGHEERLREGHDQPVGEGDGDRVGALVGRGQQHDELVAAQTGDEVAVAADRAQPVGDLDEDAVAGGVAEAVVDRLEAVEVEQHDRGTGAGGTRPRGEVRPVGQAGQRVGERRRAKVALERRRAVTST